MILKHLLWTGAGFILSAHVETSHSFLFAVCALSESFFQSLWDLNALTVARVSAPHFRLIHADENVAHLRHLTPLNDYNDHQVRLYFLHPMLIERFENNI